MRRIGELRAVVFAPAKTQRRDNPGSTLAAVVGQAAHIGIQQAAGNSRVAGTASKTRCSSMTGQLLIAQTSRDVLARQIERRRPADSARGPCPRQAYRLRFRRGRFLHDIFHRFTDEIGRPWARLNQPQSAQFQHRRQPAAFPLAVGGFSSARETSSVSLGLSLSFEARFLFRHELVDVLRLIPHDSQPLHGGCHDVLKHGAGGLSAVTRYTSGSADRDHDNDGRIFNRGKSHERGIVSMRINAMRVVVDLRCSGFSGKGIARDMDAMRGSPCFRDNRSHHGAHQS